MAADRDGASGRNEGRPSVSPSARAHDQLLLARSQSHVDVAHSAVAGRHPPARASVGSALRPGCSTHPLEAGASPTPGECAQGQLGPAQRMSWRQRKGSGIAPQGRSLLAPKDIRPRQQERDWGRAGRGCASAKTSRRASRWISRSCQSRRRASPSASSKARSIRAVPSRHTGWPLVAS